MRTVTTCPAGDGKWLYRIIEESGESYDSPPIYRTVGAARRAGLKDADMCDMFDAGEVM